MNKTKLLNYLTDKAKEYRLECKESLIRNSHMHNIFEMYNGDYLKNLEKENVIYNIQQDEIDAILVDFINYIGLNQGVDYALYVSDISK